MTNQKAHTASNWGVATCHTVDDQSQLLIVDNNLKSRVVNGPAKVWTYSGETVTVRPATLLDTLGYCKVQDRLTGDVRVERGPKLLFLGPSESILDQGQAICLSKDSKTYLLVEDKLTGTRTTVHGPTVFIPGPHEMLVEQRHAIALKANEYVYIKDTLSGKVWMERGEKLVTLRPHDELTTSRPREGLNLRTYQYVRLCDARGNVRVEAGPQRVFPLPDETVLDGGVCEAVEVDATTAVLVRDKQAGKQRLVTEQGLFVPSANEQILEVRGLTRLADYEVAIVKDATGAYRFFDGAQPDQRAFFLQPHCELVKLRWSRGRRRERRDLEISKLDTRPQYMSFEFQCRTADNVELILEGTFFWQVVDAAAMVANTGDTTGDICSHARSRFIQLISKVTLQSFMEDFNAIARQAHSDDDDFYTRRGVHIHSLEVTGYQCADKSTADILEQIIAETTNRMNRLSQQESENEVKMFRLKGDIEQERLQGELLEIRQKHHEAEAEMEGAAEAKKVLTFLRGVGEELPEVDRRVELWNVLRKTDALTAAAAGNTQLYFTPQDCNLSIENHSHKNGA